MSDKKPSSLLACEILWDCVGDKPPLLGGATLNVAYHLNKLGCKTIPVSSVGSDQLGDHSLRVIKNEWGCDISEIEVLKDVNTGIVNVNINTEGDATYVIHSPAAWDYINVKPSAKNLECEAFIYGSVALRSTYNQKSFENFLKIYQGFKCFDVNLREGQNDIAVVCKFMQSADFIKLNEDELSKIATFLGLKSGSTEGLILSLIEATGNKIICTTRGNKYPVLYWKGNLYRGKVVSVNVNNTIGAGDAFFSSMIHSLISSDFEPVLALYKASELGSWVATKKGAQPEYDDYILKRLLNHEALQQ
ncbi:PfkB family carbohydrate kinase [Sodalis sp. RH16]|uniref:PfkB family carbohydrate kinase n=1 Tax=Sodalis sp. RH16 TaxID=3394331 RepID=UPI0039B6744D